MSNGSKVFSLEMSSRIQSIRIHSSTSRVSVKRLWNQSCNSSMLGATVMSENLEQLVEVGKDLEIIGLMQEEAKALKKNQGNNQRITKTRSEKKVEGIKYNKDRLIEIEQETGKISDFEKLKNEQVNVEDNLDNLSNEINKRILTMTDENDKTVHVCRVCEKQSRKKNKLKNHIEIHLEGFSHKCNYCDIVKKTTHNLKAHEWYYHTGPNAKMASEN